MITTRAASMADQRTITIPACEQHGGQLSMTVTAPWHCRECGLPRGEPFPSCSFDGGRQLDVDSWNNSCGHIEKYADIRQDLVQQAEVDMPQTVIESLKDRAAASQGELSDA